MWRPFIGLFLLLVLPWDLIAQKEYDKNFPEDLAQYTLLVERIPRKFLIEAFDKRDSTAVVIESRKIEYIQDLYLVKEPKFPCLLTDGNEVDRLYNSMPGKYRYVLKFDVVEKKIDSYSDEVLSFYFRDLKEKTNLPMLEETNFHTKASLVLVYGSIRKAYASAK